jgi:uncharacterized protein
MLIEFRVENYRSLLEEQALSMAASGSRPDQDTRPRSVDEQADRLLPVAAIYGANASGKTNVLSALSFMAEAVTQSHRQWAPDDGVPHDPFAWGESSTRPSFFEVTLFLDGVKYEYGFLCSEERFLEEWLFAYPNKRKQTWFERDADNFEFGSNLNGENRLIEEVTRSNALFLSAAAQHNHVQLETIYKWFRTLRTIRIPTATNSLNWMFSTELSLAQLINEADQTSLFPDSQNSTIVSQFVDLLRSADIGIVGVKIDHEPKARPPRLRRPRFSLKHIADDENAWLPLDQESHGTRTLFGMGLPILRAIQTGSVILVDELEAGMHPAMAVEIVKIFNSVSTNPKNAQLIFTTHNTSLLGNIVSEPALRRDQVWLTEKQQNGSSVLYPLTDFKPRKEEHLERGYLQGRYGAIPFLGNFTVGSPHETKEG